MGHWISSFRNSLAWEMKLKSDLNQYSCNTVILNNRATCTTSPSWKSVRPHALIRRASPVNAALLVWFTYVTQPARHQHNNYRVCSWMKESRNDIFHYQCIGKITSVRRTQRSLTQRDTKAFEKLSG